MYIKEGINFRLREDLSVFHEGVLETIFVELKNNKKKESIVVGVLYRPPNSKMREFEDELEKLPSKIVKENKLFFLMGDINIDILKVPLRRKFLFLFSPFSRSNPFNEYVIAKLAIN